MCVRRGPSQSMAPVNTVMRTDIALDVTVSTIMAQGENTLRVNVGETILFLPCGGSVELTYCETVGDHLKLVNGLMVMADFLTKHNVPDWARQYPRSVYA